MEFHFFLLLLLLLFFMIFFLFAVIVFLCLHKMDIIQNQHVPLLPVMNVFTVSFHEVPSQKAYVCPGTNKQRAAQIGKGNRCFSLHSDRKSQGTPALHDNRIDIGPLFVPWLASVFGASSRFGTCPQHLHTSFFRAQCLM